MSKLQNHLQAVRDLINALPEPGKEVDFSDLKNKKEIAKRMIHNLESIRGGIEQVTKQEPITSPINRCQDWWPEIFNHGGKTEPITSEIERCSTGWPVIFP